MITRQKIILPTLAIIIVGASIFGVSQVYAQNTAVKPFNGLAQMLSQKFNLKETDVQTVLDQYKQEQIQNKEQQLQLRLEDKLNQAVTNGKISEDQKTAILNEISQLKIKYHFDQFSTMTRDQRKEAIQNAFNDFKSWVETEKIDLSLFSGMGMALGMHSFSHHMMLH